MKVSIEDVVRNSGGGLISGNAGMEELRNTYVLSVNSNSREISEGGLFVAIPGERVDGHDYVKGAYDNGAVAALVSKRVSADDVPEGKYCILVDDTVKALQKLAAWYRKQFNIPVVAVSGSVGKTTTKEMTAAALSSGMSVLKTEGNMNSQLGVALMMFRIEEAHDIAVIEMGISEPGEMYRLSEIALPDMAVITNIGVSHIGQLGSRENIRREKLDIVRGFRKKDSVLLIPGNDPMLNAADAFTHESLTDGAYGIMKDTAVLKYGVDEECSYMASDIHNENDKAAFTVTLADGKSERVLLSVLGMHNVYNALAAIAVSDRYGLDIKRVIKKLGEYKPPAMRGQVHEHNGITVIDDTYNASPDSMKSGLSTLWERSCSGRRIAVLADILELGGVSEELHRMVGAFIADRYNEGKVTDMLLTVGEEASYIAEEAARCISDKSVLYTSGDMERYMSSSKGILIKSYAGKDELLSDMKKLLKPGDMVIVKGSRGMHMDKVCEALTNM